MSEFVCVISRGGAFIGKDTLLDTCKINERNGIVQSAVTRKWLLKAERGGFLQLLGRFEVTT